LATILAPALTTNVRGPLTMRMMLLVATVQVPDGSSIE
jgi:hypothetical protein